MYCGPLCFLSVALNLLHTFARRANCCMNCPPPPKPDLRGGGTWIDTKMLNPSCGLLVSDTLPACRWVRIMALYTVCSADSMRSISILKFHFLLSQKRLPTKSAIHFGTTIHLPV